MTTEVIIPTMSPVKTNISNAEILKLIPLELNSRSSCLYRKSKKSLVFQYSDGISSVSRHHVLVRYKIVQAPILHNYTILHNVMKFHSIFIAISFLHFLIVKVSICEWNLQQSKIPNIQTWRSSVATFVHIWPSEVLTYKYGNQFLSRLKTWFPRLGSLFDLTSKGRNYI